MRQARLLPSELVTVRSAEEIFATLDNRGTLEGLPFMPEMLQYCGRRFRVWRRVEKTCVEGDRMRRMRKVVFLGDLRCGGEAHDGCDKECRLFWHEAWLNPVSNPAVPAAPGVREAVEFPFPTRDSGDHYLCQSTELLRATAPLAKWDLRQYVREWMVKTYPVREFWRLILLPFWIRLKVAFGGRSVVQFQGKLTKTPGESLHLQAGEWVDVKSREEIERTLDRHGRNRGLEFARFMIPFCGRRLRVRRRVNQIILETTAEMKQIRDTVILESCTCDGHTRWGGCPRDAHHLWREIWLKRVPNGARLAQPEDGKG